MTSAGSLYLARPRGAGPGCRASHRAASEFADLLSHRTVVRRAADDHLRAGNPVDRELALRRSAEALAWGSAAAGLRRQANIVVKRHSELTVFHVARHIVDRGLG